MTPDEYEQFRHDAVDALTDLNEDCKRRYGITTWPRWDYDLDAGNLVFSDGGVAKVIASIQVVGSTSNMSHTWLWAWANESLPPNVTEQAREVRQFGIAEGLSRLTEPQLADDEFLGWEMTAIAARIVGAKGAYRCPADNGFMYVVYKDIDEATSNAGALPKLTSDEDNVTCATHGPAQQTFVCEHLVLDPKQEWFSDEPSAAKPWPDAWCAKCDELYQEKGEWDDDNSSRLKIKLVCHQCYQALREQEPQTPPPSAR